MEGCPMEPMQQDLWIWSAREVDPVYRLDLPEHDSGWRFPLPRKEKAASRQEVQPSTLPIPLGGKRLVPVFSHLWARGSNSTSFLPSSQRLWMG